jgi:phosphatidylglycerophosphatase C
MVTSGSERQSSASGAMSRSGPLVAFDFDGTLTVRDSFTAFLRWRAGPLRYCAGLARLAPAGARWLIHRDLTRLKSATVNVFLAGMPRRLLEHEAAQFAAAAAPAMLRPDALEAWRRHHREGARMVIVTASPEAVVAPFAAALGAHLLIGSRLVYDADDRVGAGLDGLNCRGPEKVRRLRETLGPDVRFTAAYGDTDGDREMLALAEEGFMRPFTARPAQPRRSD